MVSEDDQKVAIKKRRRFEFIRLFSVLVLLASMILKQLSIHWKDKTILAQQKIIQKQDERLTNLQYTLSEASNEAVAFAAASCVIGYKAGWDHIAPEKFFPVLQKAFGSNHIEVNITNLPALTNELEFPGRKTLRL